MTHESAPDRNAKSGLNKKNIQINQLDKTNDR